MTSAEISNNYLLESEDAGGIYLDTGASNLTISRNVFKGCIRDSIAYGRSKHAINNTAFDNWSDNSQYITFAKDWIGEGCYLTEPYVYSNDEWPEKATGVMETAGVTDEYKINLSRITLPEWRNTAIYENLTQEIVEEGTIKIPLDSYVSYRLNNTSAEKPQTEESINRLMVLNNFIARDAILYNVEVPSDGEYIMEMRYSALSDVTDGKLLVGIAVNKNLAPLMTDPYNQIVYSDNSLICKQFTLPYEKTSRCRGTYYVFKDENGNPVKFNLKEGINEIYIGSRTTSDVVNINDIRIIPAS